MYDRGEFDGQLWIATEYVDGADLAQIMRDRYPAGMPLEEASAVVNAIAGALDYAHQSGMLHRDIKPANILCSQPGPGGQRIALADFGIAREINDSAGMTATNMSVGTVAYAAPEQLMGSPIDARADQYALAATAFQLLTGSEPFQSTNAVAVISQHLTAPPPRVSQARPELAALDAVFATALSKDPNHRYPNCTTFARDLADRATGISPSPHVATQAAFPSAPLSPSAPTQAAAIPNYQPPPQPFPHPGQVPSLAGSPQSAKSVKTRNVAIAASIAGAVVGASVLFFATDKPSANVAKSDTRPSAAGVGNTSPDGQPSGSAAGDQSGTRENPMRIGETLTAKDWTVTLGTPREAAAEVANANPFNKPPAGGQEFWIIPVTATYTGEGTGTAWVSVTVKFVGSDNQTYSDSCGVIPDAIFDVGELYKGGVAKGNTCVAIPKGMDGLWTVNAGILGKPVFFGPK